MWECVVYMHEQNCDATTLKVLACSGVAESMSSVSRQRLRSISVLLTVPASLPPTKAPALLLRPVFLSPVIAEYSAKVSSVRTTFLNFSTRSAHDIFTAFHVFDVCERAIAIEKSILLTSTFGIAFFLLHEKSTNHLA